MIGATLRQQHLRRPWIITQTFRLHSLDRTCVRPSDRSLSHLQLRVVHTRTHDSSCLNTARDVIERKCITVDDVLAGIGVIPVALQPVLGAVAVLLLVVEVGGGPSVEVRPRVGPAQPLPLLPLLALLLLLLPLLLRLPLRVGLLQAQGDVQVLDHGGHLSPAALPVRVCIVEGARGGGVGAAGGGVGGGGSQEDVGGGTAARGGRLEQEEPHCDMH